MAGMSNTLIDKIVNATTPTGAAGVPGTWTALSASAMKIKLTSNAPTASTAGTEITGTAYTAGGLVLSTQSTASSAGSGVTLPATSALSVQNTSGSSWTINGGELVDNAGVRTWFWTWTGAPITVANTNTFTISIGGVSINAS